MPELRCPEENSFLRPYFTAREIREAIAHGLPLINFPDLQGGPVKVVANPLGEGYLCPAFDPNTFHCRIYDVRPLDCQIYPLAVMWNREGTEVVLGWDRKCPFMNLEMGKGNSPNLEIEGFAERIDVILQHRDTLQVFEENPQLVTPFQDDVLIIGPLPAITQRVLSLK